MKRFLPVLALVALISCSDNESDPVRAVNPLEGSKWTLVSIDDKTEGRRNWYDSSFSLSFASSSVSGLADMEAFSSAYTQDGAGISFTGMTQTAPAPETGSLKPLFIKALGAAKGYSINNGILTLKYPDGTMTLSREIAAFSSADPIVRDMTFPEKTSDPITLLSAYSASRKHIEISLRHSNFDEDNDFYLYAHNKTSRGAGADTAYLFVVHEGWGKETGDTLTRNLIFNMEPVLDVWRSNTERKSRLVVKFDYRPAKGLVDYIE